MQYSIWIVTPQNYSHSKCFSEVAISLCESLRSLGHECLICTDESECVGKVIVLGAHLLSGEVLPAGSIIYNMEQITLNSVFITPSYCDLLQSKRFEMWDYCEKNIRILRDAFGVEARLCRIGYSPKLTCIENSPNPTIDILHIGSMNERREDVLQELQAKGYKVVHAFDVYGVHRDALVARSKIVLNVHFYESRIFEIVRCSYLLANRKCVVSEIGGDAMEEEFRDGICFAGYEDIVRACGDLLDNADRRDDLAERGFEIFSGMKQVDYLRGLV